MLNTHVTVTTRVRGNKVIQEIYIQGMLEEPNYHPPKTESNLTEPTNYMGLGKAVSLPLNF